MNGFLDSTLLKSFSTKDDIKKLCLDAIKYRFATVCINPCYVSYAHELLNGSGVEICTVIGFPLGANTTDVKVYEAKEAISNGASEIDMVINVGFLKDKDYQYIISEISAVKNAISGNTLKVIIETCYLDDDEIKKMTEICNDTEVDFIKTSTGFGTRGASLNDIELINKYKNKKLKVKASGGIKTREDAKKYIELGVNRIGTSNAVNMMEEK